MNEKSLQGILLLLLLFFNEENIWLPLFMLIWENRHFRGVFYFPEMTGNFKILAIPTQQNVAMFRRFELNFNAVSMIREPILQTLRL